MELLTNINACLWGPISCAIFIGVGLLLSIRTGFFQFTHISLWFRGTIRSLFRSKNNDKQKGFKPLQSLSTALAATIGTGNIAGVATAIVSGGPGAVFWMWVAALLGMMTKYAEIVLSMYFRKSGEFQSGPMIVLERGLGCKTLAIVYAFFCMVASFGIGNMSQGNSIAQAWHSSFSIPPIGVGVALALLAGFILIGGKGRVAAVTEKLIPFMAIFYLLFSGIVLWNTRSVIPTVFLSIFEGAFRFRALGGGALGYTIMQAMRYGIARGIFTNEAGLGTSSLAHTASQERQPVKQAMMGIFEVFIDTIVICTVTALVLLTTGVWTNGLSGAALTVCAFESVLGGYAQLFICISITLFAFASIISWCFYGERCVEYLWGKRAIKAYRMVYIMFVLIGAVLSLDTVWELCDICNAVIAIPNLVGVVSLSGLVGKLTKDYVLTNKILTKAKREEYNKREFGR